MSLLQIQELNLVDCRSLNCYQLVSVSHISSLTRVELGEFNLDQEFELRLDAGLRGEFANATRIHRLQDEFGIRFEPELLLYSSEEDAEDDLFDNPGGEAFYKGEREAFVDYLSKLSRLSGKIGKD